MEDIVLDNHKATKRERLGSRLGFIMISAGCAIGCGNVWKFPWMCGQYGGGIFLFVYIICLLLLGLPIIVMEYAVGRGSQASPLYMYGKLSRNKGRWDVMGIVSIIGNFLLISYYSVVCGWIIYYFVKYLTGDTQNLGFDKMIANPAINVGYMGITVLLVFLVLSMGIQNGLERVTKTIMLLLLVLMVVMAGHSFVLPGVKEGLSFYLVPDFSKISIEIVVAAMNQAFFTLSVGIGCMAIFGSYIDKECSLMGEGLTVILLDTFVAFITGMIIFPACFSYGVEVGAGPSLLFDSMLTVFSNMKGGRLWGIMFFLFMIFAALSTALAICENILAMVCELTGWGRKKACLICGIAIFFLSLTTALGYNVIKFQPFSEGTTFLDLWDFIVSNILLPIGSFMLSLFCCYSIGWGWDAFVSEANAGKGMKIKKWMRPICAVFVPTAILFLFIYGMINFNWR